MNDKKLPSDLNASDLVFESRRLDQRELSQLAQMLGNHLRAGDTLLLFGPMGVGKTTFVRALAQGLGVLRPQQVCSPTYTICLVHDGPIPLAHVDFFRMGESATFTADDSISGYAAFEALGLDSDELCNENQVLVTEWSEYWQTPPAPRIEIYLQMDMSIPELRWIELRAFGQRGLELAQNWSVASEFSQRCIRGL